MWRIFDDSYFVNWIVDWPWNRHNILAVLLWLHIVETYLFFLFRYLASSLTQSPWLFDHATFLILSVDSAFIVVVVHIILISCIFVEAVSFAFKSWSLLLLWRFLFKILYDTLHVNKVLAKIICDSFQFLLIDRNLNFTCFSVFFKVFIKFL